MPVQITIRNVPEEVRDELAARAARKRQSMQEYLRGELERIVSRPSIDEWLEEARRVRQASGKRVVTSAVIRARNADRM